MFVERLDQARAAMADGTWSTTSDDEDDDETTLQTSDRIRCLATLGAIHREPANAATCVTRGALRTTNELYPGAFLKDSGIGYVSIGGAAIVGDDTKEPWRAFACPLVAGCPLSKI